ncbi:hypothetical protein HID58_029657 [Brassica napus]|uniref:Secreted protein n=1 Tax=Brassica napus TaxID=3708 RepID=A0ABQ8CDQ3_BRANA|nr:hypothetical protein HID58_029657 [Brassica napus]
MFFPLPPPLLILLCQYVKTLVSGLSSVPRSGTPVTFSVRRSSSSGMAMRQRRFGCVNASAGGVIRSSPTSCLESLAWWCVELSTLRRHRLVTLLRHGTLRFYSSLCLNVSGDCEREEIVKN